MLNRPLTLILLPILAASLPGQRPQNGSRPTMNVPEFTNLEFRNVQFDSASLKSKASYGVFLPKSYDDAKNSERRYPLIVWLHGMNEDHYRFAQRGGAQVLDGLVGKGEVPELIFVVANGGRSSFYINGKETGAYEDLVVKDLLAEIDAKWRVKKEREQRVLMGVSMGGGAALRIAFKHPELFGTVATHAAALFPVDTEKLGAREKGILFGDRQGMGLNKIFGVPPDIEMWKRENAFYVASQMKPESFMGLHIYFDCGDKDNYGFHKPNLEMHEQLEAQKIKHTWRSVPGGFHGSGFVHDNLEHSLRFVVASLGIAAGKAGLEGLITPKEGAKEGKKEGKDEGKGEGKADRKLEPAASRPNEGK